MQGTTALMIGSSEGKVEVVRYLLRIGANINTVDLEGKSALHYSSARKRCKAVVELLADHGIDLSIKDKYGYTALDLLKELKYDEVASFLQERSQR